GRHAAFHPRQRSPSARAHQPAALRLPQFHRVLGEDDLHSGPAGERRLVTSGAGVLSARRFAAQSTLSRAGEHVRAPEPGHDRGHHARAGAGFAWPRAGAGQRGGRLAVDRRPSSEVGPLVFAIRNPDRRDGSAARWRRGERDGRARRQRDEHAGRGDRNRVSRPRRSLRARLRLGRARDLSRRPRGAPSVANSGGGIERKSAHGPLQIFLAWRVRLQARARLQGGLEPRQPRWTRADVQRGDPADPARPSPVGGVRRRRRLGRSPRARRRPGARRRRARLRFVCGGAGGLRRRARSRPRHRCRCHRAAAPEKDAPMKLRVGIDVGGTFTDVTAFDEGQRELAAVRKYLSDPAPPAAVMESITADLARDFGANSVSLILHGSTAALNTLLEGKGVRVGLLTTRGFRDVYEIGRQWRGEDVFNLFAPAPKMLLTRDRIFEIRERLGAQGEGIEPLVAGEVGAGVSKLVADGVEAVAVCFLFAYANPTHEKAAAEIIRAAAPGLYVSLSHEVNPEWREYERTASTVANAYIGPPVSRYLRALEELSLRRFPRSRALMMKSDGGAASASMLARTPIQTVM